MLASLPTNAPSYYMPIVPTLKSVDLDPDLKYYLFIYITISLFLCVEGAFRYYVVFRASLTASRFLF
jgi:hypothetical protein